VVLIGAHNKLLSRLA